MTGIESDFSADEFEALDAVAAEARMQRFDESGTVLAIGDMEVLFTIATRESRFVVEKAARGSVAQLVAIGDSAAVAARFLRFLIWDGVHGVTAAWRGVTQPLPAGFSLDERDAASLTLTWAEGDAHRSVQLPNRMGARQAITGFAAYVAAGR